VDGWYVCFAALSSNDSDIASSSARTRRGLFLDDNDNNHQNFKVSCNSDAAMKRLTKDAEANRARSALGSACVNSRYQRHFGSACSNLSSPILTFVTRSIGLSCKKTWRKSRLGREITTPRQSLGSY
jgi:hypothetical protein